MRRPTPSLFVPPSAIVQSTERTFVVRVSDGTLHQVAVARGAAMGTVVEVVGDLREGDQVVGRATDEMRDGTRVKVASAGR